MPKSRRWPAGWASHADGPHSVAAMDSRKILEVRRGLGWYVCKRRPAERVTLSGLLAEQRYQLSDLFELRIGLEDLAVSLAAVRATATELDEITKLNLAHELAEEDRDELQRNDEAFPRVVGRHTTSGTLPLRRRGAIAMARQSYGQRVSP